MNERLWQVRALVDAVNDIEAPDSLVRNTLFGRTRSNPGSLIQFDIRSGSEQVLASLGPMDEAHVREKTNFRTVELSIPRFAQKRLITAGELMNMRSFGTQRSLTTMASRVSEEQLDMRYEIDRTIEYMCVGALKGLVVDADGTTLLTFEIRASHKPAAFSGTKLWTDDASSPLQDIREWRRIIEEDVPPGGGGDYIMLCGYKVMDALLKHSDIRELLRYNLGQNIAETGRVLRLADARFIEYNGFYKDNTGAIQRYIEPHQIIFVQNSPRWFSLQYSPIRRSARPVGCRFCQPCWACAHLLLKVVGGRGAFGTMDQGRDERHPDYHGSRRDPHRVSCIRYLGRRNARAVHDPR